MTGINPLVYHDKTFLDYSSSGKTWSGVDTWSERCERYKRRVFGLSA